MNKTRAHVLISGIVQGVFFRQSTQRKAQILGVQGWVKNLPDGRVEALFEGAESSVEILLEYCFHGPLAAKVEKVEVNYENYRGEFEDFQIR